jgi:hypothetical protein
MDQVPKFSGLERYRSGGLRVIIVSRIKYDIDTHALLVTIPIYPTSSIITATHRYRLVSIIKQIPFPHMKQGRFIRFRLHDQSPNIPGSIFGRIFMLGLQRKQHKGPISFYNRSSPITYIPYSSGWYDQSKIVPMPPCRFLPPVAESNEDPTGGTGSRARDSIIARTLRLISSSRVC